MSSPPSVSSPFGQARRPAGMGLRRRWLTAETHLWRAIICGLGSGALWGAVLASMLAGYEQRLLPLPWNLLLFAFLGFAFVSAGDGILTLLWKILGFVLRRLKSERPYHLIRTIPQAQIGRLLAVVLFLYGRHLFPGTIFDNIGLPPSTHLLVWPITLGGALVAVARMPVRRQQTRLALLGVALLLNGLAIGWLLYRGTEGYLARAEMTPVTAVTPLTLPNPGLAGPYAVKSLIYGSGSDRQRDEYGVDATLVTPVVDGSAIYAGFGGLGGAIADWFWGFDYRHLPLNGRVWYPEGDGPFPLVLIVHGNHSMAHFSDAGYAYLGEHLASRGLIAVSVDENFLNGYMLADGGGQDMPLRGWLLLQHLQQWRTWNETPGTPFYQQVDLTRVALIGHSRGGEAVTHAAVLNTRLYPPVTEAASADTFGFGIRGVVGIAPSDGQFKPNGRGLILQDTSYLMLVGGHDADTHTAMAIPTYNRARFVDNPEAFAAVAYLYRANHGQFNAVWGDRDYGLMDSMLLNRRAYLSGEEQRQAAKVIITAFLEAALNGQKGYRNLFRTPHAAAAWLPEGLLVTTYKDATFLAVDTSTRGGQATQVVLPGATAVATDFSTWKRGRLMLRDAETSQENLALHLTWEAGMTPVYALELPLETIQDWALTGDDVLTFALATAQDEPHPLDLQVELETAVGTKVCLPLSQFGAIHPPLPARILKADWVPPLLGFDKIHMQTPFERVLQTYVIPLAAFQTADPAFQPDRITAIRFIFMGEQGGAVYLDEIGFMDD
ncbi:MAG: hypothetical protein IPM53_29190 [Anaerolineaceae bacterium]|nr:hypothetical protein [Anaerolineaceae bacterium]